MRINVYAEELTADSTYISKEVDGRRFYGIRLFLLSPKELHHSQSDDDRSAITFWVPWRKGSNHHNELQVVLSGLLSAAHSAEQDDKLREEAKK